MVQPRPISPTEYQSELLMPKNILAILLAAAGLTAGCGTPEPSSQVLKGTHSGTSIRLPEDKGYVELVNEPIMTDRRNPQPTSIVAYFYQADGKSPMSPSPTDVSFQIDPDARSRQRDKSAAGSSTLPLSAEPKADDPAGASRFASKTGPYALTAVRGTLKAKINRQDVSTAFMGAR